MPSTDTNTPHDIRQLDPLVINQIAAGEVIERPASVVKELVDNAIDAGPTRVVVELEKGGIELIRVSDDGRGIRPEQLPLALTQHATSKIRDVTDLDRIGTMGFRGEALASILSVSRMTIRSRTAANDQATQIKAEGDQFQTPEPASGPVGTTVTARNLFFNTPARRRFLRTIQTEKNHCATLLRDLAMSHPRIGFRLVSDSKVQFDLPPEQSPRARVLALIGNELESQMVEAHADSYDDDRGIALWGLVGLPSVARATVKHQHVFLNGRPVRDRTIQHALKEAYRGLIEPGRYPTAVLMIEMEPSGVDVNVHPAKAEVRFRDSSLVHGIVLRSVRDALRAADLTPGEQTGAVSPGRDAPFGSGRPTAPADRLVEVLRSPSASAQAPLSYERLKTALDADPVARHATTPDAETEHATVRAPTRTDAILQVHKSFIVTQDEHGIVIVDQHALHERVMFEQLLQQVTGGPDGSPLEQQRLLMPATVPLTPDQMSELDPLRPLLTRLGIEVDPIGPTAVAVHAFPTFLFERKVDAGPFVQELFERAESAAFAPESEEALHEVLDMMSCKAAVKAGDQMSEMELRRLLEMREEVERSSNCPHGRPTAIRLTIAELERRFGRT